MSAKQKSDFPASKGNGDLETSGLFAFAFALAHAGSL